MFSRTLFSNGLSSGEITPVAAACCAAADYADSAAAADYAADYAACAASAQLTVADLDR